MILINYNKKSLKDASRVSPRFDSPRAAGFCALALILLTGCGQSDENSSAVIPVAESNAPKFSKEFSPSDHPYHDARVVPITLGDSIVEPFWERNLTAWSKWEFHNEPDNAKAVQHFSRLSVSWTASEAGEGPRMLRRYAGEGLDAANHSDLVFSAAFTKGTIIQIQVSTSEGVIKERFEAEVSHNDQFLVPLSGAKKIVELEISLEAAKAGTVHGYLMWVGLRNSMLAELERERWRQYSNQSLEVFLREEPEPPDLGPLFNLVTSRQAFDEIRTKRVEVEPGAELNLRSKIELEPHLTNSSNQNLFGRRTNSVNRLRHTFEFSRSDGATETIGLVDAAKKAALAGDRAALREVAKAAVQIALIPHWDVDFITEFSGSSWAQGPFVQSEVCAALAISADLAGAWLSKAGMDLILRRLAEDGLGNINFYIWKNPAIFKNNQLPVFSLGRIAAYTLLEKQKYWDNVGSYTDLAYAELEISLGYNFLPDGGYPEGPGYLVYMLENALPAITMYGNARDISLAELAPSVLNLTDNYLEALRSTERSTQLILVGDAQGGPFVPVSPSVLSVIAKIQPDGTAARMFLDLKESSRQDLELWALPEPLLDDVIADDYEPLVVLPESGIVAVTREIHGELMKLVVVGGSKGAGHNHEDRGSFILEYAGQTFAADPGGLSYASANARALSFAQNHNMLVPEQGPGSRPAPRNPATHAVIPDVTETADSNLEVELDSGILWPEHYISWNRRFTFESQDELTITDDYALTQGTAVEFLLHTPLQIKEEAGEVFIVGQDARLRIVPGENTEIRTIAGRPLGGRELSTLIIRKQEAAGRLQTRMFFEPLVVGPHR